MYVVDLTIRNPALPGRNCSFMKNYALLFVFALLVNYAESQTTINGSFVHGGINRTYSFYVPASYTPGNPVPMVIGLHGTSSSGSDFAQYRDFRPIADTANFIVVNPDGSTMLGIRFWNYGNILGSTVDDVGFLEALIDTISAQYTINHQRIYCAGMSNGSFMSYYMACQSDRFAAIAGVTGSMSVNMYNTCTPQQPLPVIHIHGTGDSTNPYTGTSSMKAIEDVIQFWVSQNNCTATPDIFPIPDTDPNDNATAERFLYSGGTNGRTVELFKITGGGHSWPGSPMPGSSEVTCMDVDASKEIWRFFSRYEKDGVVSVEQKERVTISMWPNPASDWIEISSDQLITGVVITDVQGRVVHHLTGDDIQQIPVSQLCEGNYIIYISGADHSMYRRFSIVR